MSMGPGQPARECDNEDLIAEFEAACRGGDYEFAPEYRAELMRRFGAMVEALKFYADESTYDRNHLSWYGYIKIDQDGGRRARQVIADIEKGAEGYESMA